MELTSVTDPVFTKAFESAHETLNDLKAEGSEEATQALALLAEAFLDLFIHAFPDVALFWHNAKPADQTLAKRVHDLCELFAFEKPLEVYTCESNTLLSSRNVFICKKEISDSELKRAVFGIRQNEGTSERIVNISAFILTGAWIIEFGLISTLPMGIPFYLLTCCISSALSPDRKYLEYFPEEANQFIDEFESESRLKEKPHNITELVQATAHRIFVEMPAELHTAILREDLEKLVEKEVQKKMQELKPQPKPEIKPELPPTPKPEVKPEPAPASETQRRGRGRQGRGG